MFLLTHEVSENITQYIYYLDHQKLLSRAPLKKLLSLLTEFLSFSHSPPKNKLIKSMIRRINVLPETRSAFYFNFH